MTSNAWRRARRGAAAICAFVGACAASACAPAHTGPARPLPVGITIEDAPADSAIFARTVAWAAAQRADTLPVGELAAAIGLRFVGSTYVAGSLDPPGPERLIVNLRRFDCVTFVESMLALARSIRAGAGPADYRVFAAELMRLRYGAADRPHYTSRLHYFSDWIASNAAHDRVDDVTGLLGGTPDSRTIDFMSRHVEAYPQLAEPAHLDAIRTRERELSGSGRHRIGESAIAAAADRIRPGDVIAATSTIPGLDVAHTGLAVRVNGRIHLLHAPLAGGVVEISEEPLAERIRRIAGQDGIMVARPR